MLRSIVLLAAFVPPESIWSSFQVPLTLALHKRLPLETPAVPPFSALSPLAVFERLVFAAEEKAERMYNTCLVDNKSEN